MTDIPCKKVEVDEDQQSINSDWSKVSETDSSSQDTTESDTNSIQSNEEISKSDNDLCKVSLQSELTNEENVKDEADRIKQETIDKLTSDLESIRLKCSQLEQENERFLLLCHQKDQQLIDLQRDLEHLSFENPIVFADNRISTTFMKRGNMVRALTEAVDLIRRRSYARFYIGATSNPDDRMKAHSKKGYRRMEVLYWTRSCIDAEQFETLLLERVFYDNGNANAKLGSYGLVREKNVFYVYMLV